MMVLIKILLMDFNTKLNKLIARRNAMETRKRQIGRASCRERV